MKKQVPRKTIKKKDYQRSKWDDFNKVKVTFVLKQFRLNLVKYSGMLASLGYDGESVTTSPLTKWFLGLPKTQGRSQEIVRLAFVHNYGYEWGKGTSIMSFKSGKNPFFNQYLQLQQSPSIGIDAINLQRQKHRQILRYTTDQIIKDYITKANQRNPSRRERFTKKKIREEERDEFVLELRRFWDQLVREPTKEEIAQEYEDPEEYDEGEKEYVSEGQWGEGQYDSEEEVRGNRENEEAMPISGLMISSLQKCQNSSQIISHLINNYNQEHQSQSESLQYIPSPIQTRKKSFTLSQFDQSPCLSMAQSQDQCQKLESQVAPIRMKKTSSEESQRMMMKKMGLINLCMTDQQFEEWQKMIEWKRRERDLCGWMDIE